jgi:hypothetical protein
VCFDQRYGTIYVLRRLRPDTRAPRTAWAVHADPSISSTVVAQTPLHYFALLTVTPKTSAATLLNDSHAFPPSG